jgi:NADH-quinone oxidoreductase subunit E
MSVDLTLGPRPDEPSRPIGGPASYPADVAERLSADAATVIARYPQPRSALLPLLHLTQSEDGCLTAAGIAFCASRLGLSEAEVSAVATFYSMYRRTPTGDYLVGVCTNTLCAIMGGDAILATLEDELGIRAGQTTADGLITLEHVECNAACDYAPVVMVNWEFFDNQTPSSATELVVDLRDGRPVSPTRGDSPLCRFRQTARTLAGLPASGEEDAC